MFESFLYVGATLAVLMWAAMAAHVAYIDRRRRAARSVVADVLSRLRADDMRGATVETRLARVAPALNQVTRDMVLHTAADDATPADAFEVLAAHLLNRWGLHTLYREASFHRAPRDIWRRTAALKILFHLNHPKALDLLAAAAEGPDADVASVAFTLLGTSTESRAPEILVTALKQQRHPASRIAVHLEHSPQRPVDAYRALLTDPDSTVRFWGATLLAQYPEVDWVERELAAMIDDQDARVRKAAIQSLGKVGNGLASEAALRLLRDPKPFVRAHAARALAELERPDTAPAVAELLADADWWVRHAAKQSLEMMGNEVWPVLMRCLDHPDGFVRNGAAEVFQNLGILDNLIIMEAASDDPSTAKIDLLRRIVAAGGTRLTDSLLERVGIDAAPRVRRMLATIGFEQVGAH